MTQLHIVIAVVILTLAPMLVAILNGGATPRWMVGVAITGLMLAAIVLFMPTRKPAGRRDSGEVK